MRRAPALALALCVLAGPCAPALAQTAPIQTAPIQTAPAQTTPAQTGPRQSLTITPQAREQRAPTLSDADRRALDLFAAQPALTPARGLPIGPAYGPHDEDCVRAGAEVFCRQ